MQDIRMVDLRGQYLAIKDEIDAAIQSVLDTTSFIKGPAVKAFEADLATYIGSKQSLAVGNGTDALQIAFMALGIGKGDEVITPAFTFIATAEAAALMGAKPVFVDIDPVTFNMDPAKIEELITPYTKAIVPVHLFGQAADLDPIMDIAKRHNLYVIEDCAQAIGATYKGRKVGLDGHFGTLSCFPSKNLGAYGDAGAMFSNDEDLLHTARMIANHGSQKKYFNELVGINSRLDSIQAAILGVKLRYLDQYIDARQLAAKRYDELFAAHDHIQTPEIVDYNEHVFHQYTLRVEKRDELSAYLKEKQIPHAVYYPVPLNKLPVFESGTASSAGDMTQTDKACKEVLSLPMHTELTIEQQEHIAETVVAFYQKQPVTI